MNKALILLVALTLYCCIPVLHASSRSGCRCSKTILHRISVNNVAKVEVTPPSGRCRRAERVVITKKGSKVCISPNAEWFPEFLNRLDRMGCHNADAASCIHHHLLQ
ncbi:C-X-C motif chemokine 13 isoform X1 [Girardinichthys multiradiatus]|uniref:C-X-C motif chemokine 13 isoform X1 n=1 Tax=Girardinichthys multiradiatus TaxID=208333 RepID=UPI001FAC585A|nr:C-X-C motif chemokine 13 isoform X1 [Girardinichthys multiradiatus]